MPLIHHRKTVTGSLIGGIKNTEEVLELCGKHQIFPECKEITASGINDAWDVLMTNNNEAIRYVIDIKKSLEDKEFMPTE